MFRILAVLLLTFACKAQNAPVPLKLIRSLSGPSGKVIGPQFVLDEVRNRFVYPQDHGLVIFFEWQAPPGDHTLTATWKDPSGKVVFISPDIRMVTEAPEVRGYWNYEIYPTSPAGIWTIDVRVDGQPGGSHNFELVVPAQPATPAAPKLDDVYRNSLRSLLWIHKLDATGRRVDTSNGFVMGQDRVATAFQAIDSADGLEVEFQDGRRVKPESIAGWSRLQDWAILSVPTQATPALEFDPTVEISMSEHYVTFNVQADLTRAFGALDVTGRRQDPVFGERIQVAPALAAETAGDPLLNLYGKVVGLLGGSVVPGSRFDERSTPVSSPFWAMVSIPGSAIPIAVVRETKLTTLAEMRASNALTEPIHPNANFEHGITVVTPKKGRETPYISVMQFSRQDSISVITTWQKKEKEGKGTMSARIVDAQNRVIGTIAPKKLSLNATAESRIQFDFMLDKSPKGSYRVDVFWNDDIVWRTFVTLID